MVAGGDVGLGIFGNSGHITCAVVTRPPVCRCVMLYAFMHSHMHVCQQTQPDLVHKEGLQVDCNCSCKCNFQSCIC